LSGATDLRESGPGAAVTDADEVTELNTAAEFAGVGVGVAADPSRVFLTEAQLFKRFAPYVARIGLRLLGRESDVDDLIQEVFLAAFKQRDQLRDPNAAKNWLATIAVRTARRQLRRRRLRQFVGLDHGGPALELPDPQISPEKRALLSRVYQILDSMGVERRLAWTLRFVEGEKLEVVAERCGCSLATVKRRIASAQALLLAEMDDG
jgi:RNA polymerase sigma-70 factor (ECF subfamily)